ncbi:hypothetical protein HanLR1_Chr05g0173701 [Helianthus annuus]|nr:hypothetical protein HanLR1_Chr05g0173701 [Helianthus annuus]
MSIVCRRYCITDINFLRFNAPREWFKLEKEEDKQGPQNTLWCKHSWHIWTN